MPTKQQVIASITSITTNGANTAQKVRSVLNEIVEFADNLPAPPPPANNIKLFSHKGNTTDKTKITALKFSFRGIESHSVNFTFQIQFKENADKLKFEYTLPAEVMASLVSVLEQSSVLIDFDIPLRRANLDIPFNTTLMGVGISKDKKMLILDFTNPNGRLNPGKGDSVYSSIHFHSPFND